MLNDTDYKRIESEIASDASPVGIDAKKTQVMILVKLESIERRLDKIERHRGPADGVAPEMRKPAENGVAALTDTFDEAVDRFAKSGIDVDDRGRHALSLIEKLTQPDVLTALARIVERAEARRRATTATRRARSLRDTEGSYWLSSTTRKGLASRSRSTKTRNALACTPSRRTRYHGCTGMAC